MIVDYDSLLGEFSGWLMEQGVQTQPQLLIRLAEDDLAGDARLYDKAAAEIELTTAGIVALPADLAEVLAWTLAAPWTGRLAIASEIDSASLSTTGRPRTYHIVGSNAYLRPVPHENMTSELTYRKRFVNLGPDAQTNEYVESWPSLYWYACQEQAANYAPQRFPQGAEMAYRAKKDKTVLRVKSAQERKVFGGVSSRKTHLGGSLVGF